MRRAHAGEVEDLANLFLTGNLTHPLELSVDAVTFTVADIGEPDREFGGQMKYRVMSGPDEVDAVQVNGRSGWLHLGVGQWLDQPDNEQVVLSSGRKELDPRFGQINLNLSLTDGKVVYLVKNLTKEGRSGAMKRLYGGASGPEMRQERELRRSQLAAALGSETLPFEGEDWLVVAALPLPVPLRRLDALFTEAMVQILRYAAQVERLRRGADLEDDIDERPADAFSRRPSAAERKLIELEAMTVVRAHLVKQGYRVKDVASRESYDFEARRKGQFRFVEVKGTTTRPWSVELTGAEHRVATNDRDRYTMFVVIFQALNRLTEFELIEVGNPLTNSAYSVAPVRYRVREC